VHQPVRKQKIQGAIDRDGGWPRAPFRHAVNNVIGTDRRMALCHTGKNFTPLAGQFAAAFFASALRPGDQVGGAMGVIVLWAGESHECYNITYLRKRQVPRQLGETMRSEIMAGTATSIVHVENDRVIVTEWRFAPGANTGWHRHEHDYVVVPLMDGKVKLETKDGTSFAEMKKGAPYFRRVGVEHDVINANDGDYAFIEIELK
jgi:beta-alanine degradation protein BauB